MKYLDIPAVARILAVVTLGAMIVYVAFSLYLFLDSSLAKATVLQRSSSIGLSEVSASTVRLALLVGLFAVAAQLYILNAVRALFSLYACGVFLTEENGRAITQIGLGLVALPLIRFAIEPLQTMILTREMVEGSVSISISGGGVAFVLGGVLMLMIGRSMYQASEIRIENEAFL